MQKVMKPFFFYFRRKIFDPNPGRLAERKRYATA